MSMDWSFWLAMPTVEVWQACALSLAIDPDTLPMDQYARAYEGVGLPVLGTNCFSAPELADKFNKRLRLLTATLSAGEGTFRRPRDIGRAPSQRKIYLPDFATWAASIAVFDGLPPPLIALVKTVEQGPEALDTEHSALPAWDSQRAGVGILVAAFPQSQTKGAGSDTLTDSAGPKLKIGSNARTAVAAYIAHWAPRLRAQGDTAETLAQRILEHIPAGCSGERAPLNVATIVRMLPPGLTGGRQRNGVRAAQK